MAVIRLKVDVDSDVYPELYARLSSIERAAAREERLRQLAAVGLIWEAVRMHGPAATALPPPVPPLPDAAPRPPAPRPKTVREELLRVAAQEAPQPREASSQPDALPAVPVLFDIVDEAEVSSPVPLDEPPLPPPLQTQVQPAATRSTRMKRMVDRGLFKNG